MSETAVAAAPRTKFFLRTKETVEGIWGAPSYSRDGTAIETDVFFQENFPAMDQLNYSSDGGRAVFVLQNQGFQIVNTDNGECLVDVKHPGIQVMTFSPKGTFLLSWQRPQKDSDLGNLIVWDSHSGEIVARYHQRSYSRQKWPEIKWSDDEAICARMVTNEVHICNGGALDTIIDKIRLPGVNTFSVSPGEAPYKIATFVPEKQGKPASVGVYHFPNQLSRAVAFKSFYKAKEVEMKWAPNGFALIIQTSTDLDTSGKSYYGETGLFYLQSDGSFDCVVPLTKEGQVHDVAWDPNGKGFVVLAGSMPSNATLYDNKACPVFEFGTAPRNQIHFSPHGRFLCIAGFGNLRGDMDFWDRNKLKKMGTANSNSTTTCCWSPDSRYFATATTFPRLRVDNGFKLFKYDGKGPIQSKAYKELYDLSFRPASKDVYPNRPSSPRSKKKKNDNEPEAVVELEKPKVYQAYRPPNAGPGGSKLAAMLRREDGQSKRIDPKKYQAPQHSIPGQKALKTIPGQKPAKTSNPQQESKNQLRKKKAKEKKETIIATESALKVAPVKLTTEEKQKKIKNLMKKLKQIQELKKRQSSGEALNEDQLEKIKTEDTIQLEVQSLSEG